MDIKRLGNRIHKIQKGGYNSFSFLFEPSRFVIVGVSGLLVNFSVSYILTHYFLNLWYMEATVIGFICSVTSNFLLNKIWTFQDRNFSARHFFRQYGMYIGIGSVSGTLQLVILYLLFEYTGNQYALSLLVAILIASFANFTLNKKWTFKRIIWS